MEKRMGKGWKHVGTNALESFTETSKKERYKKGRKFDNAIKQIVIQKEEDLVKESLKAYKEKIAYEDQLLKAKEDKVLKSEKLYEEAKEIETLRAKRNKRKKKSA